MRFRALGTNQYHSSSNFKPPTMWAENERSNNEYQMARNWNLDELDATNKLINLYNAFHSLGWLVLNKNFTFDKLKKEI